jgi:hypothetical protein
MNRKPNFCYSECTGLVCLANCCSQGVGLGQSTKNRGQLLGRKSLQINDFVGG